MEWLRQNLFPRYPWLLDRWHLAQTVRAFTGPNQAEFRRLMQPIWNADSLAALAALRTSPLRHQRPKQSQTLLGYLLGNRQRIDAWRQIRAGLQRGRGHTRPQLKPGSGAVEKNIEVRINRALQTPGPKLESPPRRTAAPTQTTPGLARSLERLVETQNPNFTSNPTRPDLPSTDS